MKSPFEKDIPFSLNYILYHLAPKKFWKKRGKSGHFKQNSISKQELVGLLKKNNFKVIKYHQFNFFIDKIYDYVLPSIIRDIYTRKAKTNSNHTNAEPVTKDKTPKVSIKLSTIKAILNRLFGCLHAILLSVDLGLGNHFIGRYEKLP